MPQVIKNLVVGGVNTKLREHNQKGFEVREAGNLRFNNGFITGTIPRDTLVSLAPASGSTLYDNVLNNQVAVP